MSCRGGVSGQAVLDFRVGTNRLRLAEQPPFPLGRLGRRLEVDQLLWQAWDPRDGVRVAAEALLMDKVFLQSLVALDVFGGKVAPEGRRVGPKGRHSRRVVFMVVHCASPDGCFCAVAVAMVVGRLRRKWAVKKGRDSGLEKRERCHRWSGYAGAEAGSLVFADSARRASLVWLLSLLLCLLLGALRKPDDARCETGIRV